jgi:hypothetical protein
LTTKRQTTYNVRNADPGMGQVQQFGGVKPIDGSQPSIMIELPTIIQLDLNKQ